MSKYTIDQLCERTGLPRRTIRFYVAQGVIEPPAGRGRGGFYNEDHLVRLLKISALQKKGLTLDAIAVVFSGKAPGARHNTLQLPFIRPDAPPAGRRAFALYDLAPGIALQVSRDAEDANARLIRKIVNYAKEIAKEGNI